MANKEQGGTAILESDEIEKFDDAEEAPAKAGGKKAKVKVSALRAEIAALKAENERLRNQPPPEAHVPAARDDEPKQRFLISLKDCPDWVVKARGEHQAFQAYKKAIGLITSPNEPTVVATDLPVGRHPPLPTHQTVAEIQASIAMPTAAG